MTGSILDVASRLGSSADALAAPGALIRMKSEHLPVDLEAHAVLQAIGAWTGPVWSPPTAGFPRTRGEPALYPSNLPREVGVSWVECGPRLRR